MREHKFRSWFRQSKKMSKAFTLDMLAAAYAEGYTEGKGEGSQGDFQYLGGMTFNTPIVMQYIGVKDKNGKEIYEGDILQYLKRPFDCTATYQVKSEITRNCGCCGFIYGWDMPVDQDRCEVIGNIYENPELLESNK